MILAIVGATGTGKSELSLSLAKTLNAEIINADAFQVYQGMDIGTAKLPANQRQNIVHHLIDIISPEKTFDVASYQHKARHILDSNPAKNYIFVGGSGFYLKSVLHAFSFPEKKVARTGEDLSNEALYEALKSLDPKSAEKIHPHNRKRLLNATQRAQAGIPMSAETDHAKKRYDYQMIGLEMPRDDLYQRLETRVDAMIEKGLEAEVRDLMKKGLSITAQEAIGYKEWIPYFQGTMDLKTVKATIQQNTRRYAKRQMTYFKHQFDATWLDLRFVSDPVDYVLKKL